VKLRKPVTAAPLKTDLKRKLQISTSWSKVHDLLNVASGFCNLKLGLSSL